MVPSGRQSLKGSPQRTVPRAPASSVLVREWGQPCSIDSRLLIGLLPILRMLLCELFIRQLMYGNWQPISALARHTKKPMNSLDVRGYIRPHVAETRSEEHSVWYQAGYHPVHHKIKTSLQETIEATAYPDSTPTPCILGHTFPFHQITADSWNQTLGQFELIIMRSVESGVTTCSFRPQNCFPRPTRAPPPLEAPLPPHLLRGCASPPDEEHMHASCTVNRKGTRREAEWEGDKPERV